MSFTVRVPGPDDAERIARLHVATWRETYAHLLPEGFFDDAHAEMRRGMWRRILGDPREDWSIRIAEDEGELLGFAMAGPSFPVEGGAPPRDRQLYSIYVRAARHGRGIGRALLDGVLDAEPAMLWVAEQNPRAIAFYRRNGFAPDGESQVDPAVPGITELRMVR